MSASRTAFCLLVGFALLLAAVPTPATVVEDTGLRARIPKSSPPAEPVLVPHWDPASPQQLVRIDGVLYQEGPSFYYKVVENEITARLAEGVAGWDDLVNRASAASPQTFGLLAELTPVRSNRLGIVDLEIPSGEVTDWGELIHLTGLVKYAEVSTYGTYLAVPNDPQYSSQWALNNTGQTGGSADADIDAPEAWDLGVGDQAVVVGVLDSGTDVDHDDLAPNVWHNEGEIPNNSIDDDSNGFVDDWEGWDFGNNNNDPRTGFFHGTHVTGIINAASDTGIGIAGLAGGFGGPGARGMAVAVGEFGPVGGIIDDAVIYAADNGAQVITLSLSVGSSTAINDALDYAYNTRDVFIDCAAGNGGGSVGYPAVRAEVMAVASTDDNDNRSSFSNQGPQVEIAAPGSDILSTQIGNTYGTSSGTSFAAPYVGALAALIRGLNPGLTAPEVRQLIIDTADDVASPGFDNQTGWGRINAFAALSMTAVSDGIIQLDSDRYACSDSLSVSLIDFDLAGSGSVGISVNSGTETDGESVVLTETVPGSGRFTGNLSTAAGVAAPDGTLQVAHDDTLTAEYVDADDGEGGVNVLKIASALADCLGPELTDIAAGSISDVTATITWTTDEPATSLVRYGASAPPTQQASSGGLNVSHDVQLTGLQQCTVYRFEAESGDQVGNTTAEDNGGVYFSFETFGNFPEVGIVPCHQGQASLDRQTYDCVDTAQISVTDIDLDTDPGTAETIQVLMTSSSEPEGEWTTLTEAGAESNQFEGSIDLNDGPPAANGVLDVAPGDLITVTYFDADDGDGRPRVDSFVAVADCLAPQIRDIQVTAISSTRAEITWSTDEQATSRVEFGPTPTLGSVVEDLQLDTSHSLAISAFLACDRIYFRVSSADAFGDTLVADAAGQPFEFNLNQIGGALFHDNFETDNGWNLRGEWERAAPQGLGSSSGDPDAAYSGSGVMGTDLTGQGSFPGDYEPVTRERAISPTLDATGFTNLELILRRKLGVTSGDSAEILVQNPSVSTVWTSSGVVNDADWIEVRHDISAEADGVANLKIAISMDSNDPGQSFGWNVDEIVIKDATQPDYLACGTCTGAPTFAGLTQVYDADPCGASGLTLEWEPAPAWGTAASGTYDVHRGTTSDFVPDASNRIATGVNATSWIDTGAPVDTTVWYVVRARNAEDCGGEGLAEDNLVRMPATETLTQPLPTDPGDSLRVLAVGQTHVRLSWTPAPGAVEYSVRRSPSTDFDAPVEIGTTSGLFFEDVNAVLDGSSYSYRVFPLNACGQEAP